MCAMAASIPILFIASATSQCFLQPAARIFLSEEIAALPIPASLTLLGESMQASAILRESTIPFLALMLVFSIQPAVPILFLAPLPVIILLPAITMLFSVKVPVGVTLLHLTHSSAARPVCKILP